MNRDVAVDTKLTFFLIGELTEMEQSSYSHGV